jgi:hypothetical protein
MQTKTPRVSAGVMTLFSIRWNNSAACRKALRHYSKWVLRYVHHPYSYHVAEVWQAMRTYVLVVVFIFANGALGHSQSLDQQERCALQAKRSYQEIDARHRAHQKQLGGMSQFSGDYQSHYNTKTGKCLMLVKTSEMLGEGVQMSNTVYMMDANERRQYATYLWAKRNDKKPWVTCELSAPLLENRYGCSTREEFDAFVAPYLKE